MKVPYLIIQAGFLLVTFVFYTFLLIQLQKSLRLCNFTEIRKKKIFAMTLVSLVTWAVATSLLSISGFITDFSTFPPKIIIVLLVPLVVIIWAVNTTTVKELLKHVAQEYLILLQSFRIVVEILLWLLFINGLAPVQMTFEGRNFDVLSGVSAILIAFLVSRKKAPKPLIIAWHFACLVLLVNIVTTAILSMPTQLRVFMNEPSNTIVAEFPIVWLPGFLVPLAYGLHFLALRQLFMKTSIDYLSL